MKTIEINTIHDITEILARRYLKMIGFNKDQHLRNYCLQIIDNINKWPLHKSSRRLGYVQKGILDHNLTTVGKENLFTKPLFDQLKEKTFSDKVIILFIDENNIVHKTIFETQPNIASLNHLFDELTSDTEFGMTKEYVETLKIKIMTLTEYNKHYDDFSSEDFEKMSDE